MTRYAIYACDAIYEGMNGMYSKDVVTCDNYAEAVEIAHEKSWDIINSYFAIYDSLEGSLREEYGDDPDVLDEHQDEFYEDDVEYTIYEIDETVAKGYSNEELLEKFYDEDNFVQEFCLKN